MNLEQLRKQAKELVRAARDGDLGALARLGDLPARLASAQLVLAATSRRRDRAERLLAARPSIGDDRWSALVLGRGWAGDPNEPGGPRPSGLHAEQARGVERGPC
jgi:hypothetical protein